MIKRRRLQSLSAYVFVNKIHSMSQVNLNSMKEL